MVSSLWSRKVFVSNDVTPTMSRIPGHISYTASACYLDHGRSQDPDLREELPSVLSLSGCCWQREESGLYTARRAASHSLSLLPPAGSPAPLSRIDSTVSVCHPGTERRWHSRGQGTDCQGESPTFYRARFQPVSSHIDTASVTATSHAQPQPS